MTAEETHLINESRVMIVGSDEFFRYIMPELKQVGFDSVIRVDTVCSPFSDKMPTTIIEYTGDGPARTRDVSGISVIYPFDSIAGAGAIVLFPDDERGWFDKPHLREWTANYMAGYCAFWNVEWCDWLYEALPSIMERRTNAVGMQTAAYMCARIVANIVVGRDVKWYPRFYLVKN